MTHSGCREDLLPHRVPAAQRRDCGHSGAFQSPLGFARSEDSTTSGSGHHHPARHPIFEREPGKPSIKSAHPLAAGGIAATAKNEGRGQQRTNSPFEPSAIAASRPAPAAFAVLNCRFNLPLSSCRSAASSHPDRRTVLMLIVARRLRRRSNDTKPLEPLADIVKDFIARGGLIWACTARQDSRLHARGSYHGSHC